MKLRTRLAVVNGLVLATVFVALGLTVRTVAKAILVNRVDDLLSRKTDGVRRMYFEILKDPVQASARRQQAEDSVSSLEKTIRSLPATAGNGNSRSWPIRVLDLNGKAFLRAYARMQGVDEPWDRATFDEAANGKTTVVDFRSTAGEPYRLKSEPVVVGGKVLAIVQGAEPMADTFVILARLDRALLEIAAPAIMVSVFLGWLLASIALRPAVRLARSIGEVDSDHLSTRIETERNDELGAIANGFNEMLARLEEAFNLLEASRRQKQQFTADISHELRNPLTTVTTNVSLTLNDPKLSKESRHALEAALRASRSMTRLVEDLLLLARADESPSTKADSVVDLGSLIEMLADQMNRDGMARISVSSQGEVLVLGDSDHLERVFRNLIENAQNYSDPGTEIDVTVTTDTVEAKITVEDRGTGIPHDMIDRVKERFFRVDSGRGKLKSGTGLGLTICDTLVKAHGGELVLESALGEGTRATVLLPAFHHERAPVGAAL